MTITLFSNHRKCSDDARRVNLTFFGGQPVVKCLRVQVSDLKKANSCGLRSIPRTRKLREKSRGYVMGREFGEYKQCGLKQTRSR